MSNTHLAAKSEALLVAPTNNIPPRLEYEATLNVSFEQAPPNKEDITLIWLDIAVDSTLDGQRTAAMFREVVNFFWPFTDLELCVKSIEDIKTEKVLLVVSGAFSRQVIPRIQPLKQVDSIYIFCAHPDRYQDLLHINDAEPNKSKIRGIFSQQTPLKNIIRQDVIPLRQHLATFSVFKQQKTTRDLTRESASFLWFQLLSIVLRQMPFIRAEAMNEMLTVCEKFYYKNVFETTNIDEFRQTYSPDIAIYWYTRESFAFRLTNKALRTEDTEMLYIFRFFITDLSKQLTEAYKSQLKDRSLPSRVFRGVNMPSQEVKRLEKTGLISQNGFMSTSRSSNEALKFLIDPSTQPDAARVLFEIDITQCELCVCADISKLSFIKTEQEVLFDVGTAFCIDEINENVEYKVQLGDEGPIVSLTVWHVKLSVTAEGSKTKNDYLALVHKELEQTSETVVFGQLLLDMGNYVMAKKYFLNLLQKLPKDDPSVGIIHYSLGRAYFYAKDLVFGLASFKDALKCQEKGPSTHLVFTLVGIGQIYERNGLRSEARDCYMQALEQCESKLGGHNCRPAAITFNSLGSLYAEELQFDSALECYKTSLEIFQCLKLPNNHPDIASIECNMGDVYRRRTDWDSALKQYEKSLQMFTETLPDDHPSIAYCHSLIGLLHLQKNQIELARKHFQEALEKYKKNGLPNNHKNIQNSLYNLTRVTYEEALQDYSKVS